jgi:nitroreductase
VEPKEVLDFICHRRSIRRFQKKEIPEEIFELLLKAAMAAPTANNVQPWEFIIVREPKTKEALSQVHPWAYMAADSPAAIVVAGDKRSEWWKDDCSAAAENLLIAAANVGLGTVWCGTNRDHANSIRKILAIPEVMGVLCIIPIGYPAEFPTPQTKFRKDKIHWESFSQ